MLGNLAAEIASNEILDEAYAWLCKRRENYSHNDIKSYYASRCHATQQEAAQEPSARAWPKYPTHTDLRRCLTT